MLVVFSVCFVSGQTFDEIYNYNTDFYSTSDYEKINSRVEKAGKSWTVLMYDLGLDATGGQSDINMLKDVSKSVSSPKMHFAVQTRNSKGNIARYRLTKGSVTSVFEKKSFASCQESLTNFIQWGKKTYPADKMVLVIRGLGASVSKGICFDGFSGEGLTVSNLRQALVDGGVDFDLVVLDSDFSANLEIAYSIAPNAKYMLASQESLWVDAINYKRMATYLNAHLSGNVESLCRVLIDDYLEKNCEDISDRRTLSLVNLKLIGPVFTYFTMMADDFDLATTSIDSLAGLSKALKYALSFGHITADGFSNMSDLADCAIWASDYLGDSSTLLLDSIYSAVTYQRHGEDLPSASGLSFFYPQQVTKTDLNSYAENFGCGPYFAYLDAVNDGWTAPSWVYSSFGKKESGKVPCKRAFVPEKSKMHPISYKEKALDDSVGQLTFSSGAECVSSISFNATYMNEKNGAAVSIENCGEIEGDDNGETVLSQFTGSVLCFEGVPIYSTLVESSDWYEIYVSPVKHNGVSSCLVIYHDLMEEKYTILGIYPKTALNGAVSRIKSELTDGDLLEFIFPAQFGVDIHKVMTDFGSLIYYSQMEVKKDSLPDGYYLNFFTITDCFGNKYETMGFTNYVQSGFVFDLD